LGDCYCAAVVEALSKDDLERMDREREMADESEKAELIKNMENGEKVARGTNKVHKSSGRQEP
jgi:hypothetical protein